MTWQSWYDSLDRKGKIHYKFSAWLCRVEDRYNDLTDKYPKLEKEFVYTAIYWPKRKVCLIIGHNPTMDHCGIPAHDYCSSCGKLMPNQAKRNK